MFVVGKAVVRPEELSRFENSRNVEMMLRQLTDLKAGSSGFPVKTGLGDCTAEARRTPTKGSSSRMRGEEIPLMVSLSNHANSAPLW